MEAVLRRVVYLSLIINLSGCAYHAGNAHRTLPGGYRQLAIPMFKNLSQEVGAEVAFTNAMIREFEQSEVAEVVPVATAPLKLEGEIVSIKYEGKAPVQGNSKTNAIPDSAVLNGSYRIVVEVVVRLRRTTDQTVLWQGSVVNERSYNAPRIGSAVVNSANVLYNQSARNQNVGVLAIEMMEEAHDRMTENF